MIALPIAISIVLLFLFSLSIASLRQQVISNNFDATELLFTQTMAFVFIAVLTVGASVITIAIIGMLISEPICKLAEEAKQMASGKVDLSPLSQVERLDEVGLMARQMNSLIDTVRNQDKALALQKSEAALGKVASQVAHDLRNPLSAVDAAVGKLKSLRLPNTEVSEVLDILELGCTRLSHVASELLRKYKGEEGTQTYFSLHAVLDELIGECQSQTAYQNIRFMKQYHSQSISLLGNADKLQRAFGNVVKNAMEAMEGCGIMTVVTVTDGEKVKVSITDTGAGMDADRLTQALSGGSVSDKKEGHGIGLGVVRETITEFGGRLEGVSHIGQGTTLTAVLPIFRAEESGSLFTLKVGAKEPVVVIWTAPLRLES